MSLDHFEGVNSREVGFKAGNSEHGDWIGNHAFCT